MAMALVTILARSWACGGTTYTVSSGGPVEISFNVSSDVVRDASGDSQVTTFIGHVNVGCHVEVTVRDIVSVPAIDGSANDGTALLASKSGQTDRTIQFPKLKFGGCRGDQAYGRPAGITLLYDHESVDGTTMPITVS